MLERPVIRAERADAEGVIEAVTLRLDPEHHPDDEQIEKEDDVRDVAEGKGHGNDGRRAGDGSRGGQVETSTPDHDPPHLAAVNHSCRSKSGQTDARITRPDFKCGDHFAGSRSLINQPISSHEHWRTISWRSHLLESANITA